MDAVWPLVQGRGVVIGILSTGLQHAHPDLQPNYSPELSWDFADGDPDPSPQGSMDFFGTAAAGIAAARGDNLIGVSGAAPQASIAGIRFHPAGPPEAYDAQIAAALVHQLHDIHIVNDAWAARTWWRDRPGPETQAAIRTAAERGRRGKGRILVFSASAGFSGQDNCNGDEWATNRFAIAVGGLGEIALAHTGRESCSALFAVAPTGGTMAGIPTTDLVGPAGVTADDYAFVVANRFDATAVTSGVVALMLERNPALTWRDVQHILARSSYRLDPTDPGWTTGRYAHNERYGFGQIDAEAAVRLAGSWRLVPPERAIPEIDRTPNLPIPDDTAEGQVDTITIDASYANFTVEHVEVELTARHPRRGELEITLISPSGVASRLAWPSTDWVSDFSAWRFRSVRHWGETAAGVWTLRVADRAASNTGVWNRWTLRVFGTQPNSSDSTSRTISDFDGDGRSDLLWRNASGEMAIWLMNGTQPLSGASFPVDADWRLVGNGDYNGDLKADLLWRNGSGTVVMWLMNGTQIQAGAVVATVDPAYHVVGTADYNGDGNADILWRHTSGLVVVWLMNGRQIIGGGEVASAEPAWQIVSIGDWTGDSRADILWRHTTGWFTVWAMNGTQIVGGGRIGFVDPAWRIMGMADYNADRRDDILWRHTSGQWAISFTGTQQHGGFTIVDPAWQIVGRGDYNGDGFADILWRHTSGQVAIWLMEGAQARDGGAFTTVDPSWVLVDLNQPPPVIP